MNTPVTLSNFEQSLMEISNLIKTMEIGELTLAQSLEHFDRGMHLIKECQQLLMQAEQKVQILMQRNNDEAVELSPYTHVSDRTEETGST